MFIIHVQAANPERKAAIKPTDRGTIPIELIEDDASDKSNIFAPIIGANTIRKENFAISPFLFPNSKPVAIVEPERETPGNTAKAWAIPIIRES